MFYFSHSAKEINEMLDFLGVEKLSDLFKIIPESLLKKAIFNNIESHTEPELIEKINKIKNKNFRYKSILLGAGIYNHFIPITVDYLSSRSEFYTAYTPYQAEASQGNLQVFFEYQTAISRLTATEISNASMYDGASAAAEAVLISLTINRRQKIAISETVHKEYIETIETYLPTDKEIIKIHQTDGVLDYEELEKIADDTISCLVIQYPNFLGNIEDLKKIKEICEKKKILLISAVNPISLGMLKSPAEFGSEIIVGDGQVLGNYMNYGGPSFGFLCTSFKLIRKIPGRIIGETVDKNGNKGYCLTFQTREQHIKREKATSNICSNHALGIIRAIIYLAYVGEYGFKQISRMNFNLSHYFYDKLIQNKNFEPAFEKPFFNEFVIKTKISPEKLNQILLNEEIIGGFILNKSYENLPSHIMFAITEKLTISDCDNILTILNKI